ncbi:MAG: hypothetical protein U1E32_02825 [Rhodoglobus sp.]|nr:hypothetical protein [Rhodoglobus sp.]
MPRYRAPKPTDRALRVWHDGRDITDDDPATWGWPYSDWFAQGWRPAGGPNSTLPGLVDGGIGTAPLHGTSGFAR